MPKHSSTPKRPRDFNARAFDSVARLTGTLQASEQDVPLAIPDVAREEKEERPEKNPAAVALGRLGGLKGGKARLTKLTAERRREIAKAAAVARWSKKS
jgi:hypothetical protein